MVGRDIIDVFFSLRGGSKPIIAFAHLFGAVLIHLGVFAVGHSAVAVENAGGAAEVVKGVNVVPFIQHIV